MSVLKPVNVMGTRWVSHLSRALTVLLKNMRHIVLHLQHTVEARSSSSEMQGRAKLVSRQLQSLKTVMFMHFILDVLEETSIVSHVFQKESSTLTTVCTALQRVELGMSAMVGRPAQHLQMFLENCITDGSCTKFKDVELVGDYEEEIAALTAVKTRIIDCVLEFLSSRFTSLESNAVLHSGKIFDHKIWPEDNQELATYGEDDLRTLATHFQDPLDNHGFNLAYAEQE